MSTNINTEIQNLENRDPAVYNRAFENLVQMNSGAIPALLAFLTNKKKPNRQLAAAAIATIADKSAANEMVKYTEDENSMVRAWSAIALKKMGDQRALHSLLKTINDFPDEAHSDQTLTTYALIQWGEPVLQEIINLLNAPNGDTRRHAFAVLKKIVFNTVQSKDAWEKIWKANGNYEPFSGEAERSKATQKWQEWIKKQ